MHHHLFREKKAGDRVTWKGSSVAPTGSKLLPGANLRDLVAELLGGETPYRNWIEKGQEVPLRPSGEELENAEAAFTAFLDEVQALRPFDGMRRGETLDEWREFRKKGHLLVRPLGLSILATVVGQLSHDDDGPQIDPSDVFAKVRRLDHDLQFENVTKPASPWFGVTYSPERDGMKVSGRALGIRLLRYLVAPSTFDSDEREELRLAFAEVRKVIRENGSEVWFNFDGAEVTSLDKVKLPLPA